MTRRPNVRREHHLRTWTGGQRRQEHALHMQRTIRRDSNTSAPRAHSYRGNRIMMRRIAQGLILGLGVAACSDRPTVTAPNTPSIRGNTPAFDRSAGDTKGQGGLRAGGVYAATNQPAGNAIVAYRRASDGSLTVVGSFPTGGAGIGGGTDPLASEGSVVLSGNSQSLFVVNAGSNDVSALRVEQNGLVLVSRVPSGGTKPTSLTVHDDLLYVMNAGSGTINGFHIGNDGSLTAIPGSARPITGGSTANPSQIKFSPDGAELVVTGKTLNNIDTYIVGHEGLATGPHANASHGASPFGFDFASHDHFVVSEPAGSASSYALSAAGTATVISGSVPDLQMAPCWLIITRNGKYAYAANAGSQSISSYQVARDGSLSLLASVAGAADPAGAALDLALTAGSRFLYVLNDVSGTVVGFRVNGDGSLTRVAAASGLPANAQGIAAR